MKKRQQVMLMLFIFAFLIFFEAIGNAYAQEGPASNPMRLYPVHDSTISLDDYGANYGKADDLVISYWDRGDKYLEYKFVIAEFDFSGISMGLSQLKFRANIEPERILDATNNLSIDIYVWSFPNRIWNDEYITIEGADNALQENLTQVMTQIFIGPVKTNIAHLIIEENDNYIEFPINKSALDKAKNATFVFMGPSSYLYSVKMNARESQSPIYIEVVNGVLISVLIAAPILGSAGVVHVRKKRAAIKEELDNVPHTFSSPKVDDLGELTPINSCPKCFQRKQPDDLFCSFCGSYLKTN
jgi:hypothetical protein